MGFGQAKPEESNYSQMWEVYPAGISQLIERVWQDYQPKHIFVAENGICVPDAIDFDQHVRDPRRIQYLQDHLREVQKCISKGIPVKGYFVWSLFDNFEWSFGYNYRFGIVFTDFTTQNRIIKDSGWWYQKVIENNGFVPDLYYKPFRF